MLVDNLEGETTELSLDFITGVDWNVFNNFAIATEMQHFQKEKLNPPRQSVLT